MVCSRDLFTYGRNRKFRSCQSNKGGKYVYQYLNSWSFELSMFDVNMCLPLQYLTLDNISDLQKLSLIAKKLQKYRSDLDFDLDRHACVHRILATFNIKKINLSDYAFKIEQHKISFQINVWQKRSFKEINGKISLKLLFRHKFIWKLILCCSILKA